MEGDNYYGGARKKPALARPRNGQNTNRESSRERRNDAGEPLIYMYVTLGDRTLAELLSVSPGKSSNAQNQLRLTPGQKRSRNQRDDDLGDNDEFIGSPNNKIFKMSYVSPRRSISARNLSYFEQPLYTDFLPPEPRQSYREWRARPDEQDRNWENPYLLNDKDEFLLWLGLCRRGVDRTLFPPPLMTSSGRVVRPVKRYDPTIWDKDKTRRKWFFF